MHHANLPIKIIIKRYLSLAGEEREEVGGDETPYHTAVVAAPSLFLHRQAVIFHVRKSERRWREDGRGWRRKRGKERARVPDTGKRQLPALRRYPYHPSLPGEIYRTNLEEESRGGEEEGKGEGVEEEEEGRKEGRKERGAFEKRPRYWRLSL